MFIGASETKSGSTSSVGAVFIYDAKTLEFKAMLQPTAAVVAQGFGQSMALSADGQWLAVGAYSFKSGTDPIGRWYLYQRGADKFTYNLVRTVNGVYSGGYMGWSAAMNDDASKIWFGAPYAKISSAEYGVVSKFNSAGTNTGTLLGNVGGVAGGKFAQQIKYSKALGAVIVGRGMPPSTQQADVEIFDETTNAFLTSIKPPASATYASYYFGLDFDISPDGKYLVIDAPGYRVGDVAGGLAIGAYHLYKLSRSGNTITVTKLGVLEKPGDNSSIGQGWVTWLNNNILIAGSYTNKADVGSAYAGGVFLIKRTGDQFAVKNPEAPWLAIESVGTYTYRYLGFRTGFSLINKRLYASANNDLNPAGQPTGRLYYWDYE